VLQVADRVLETTTSTGTGDIALAGAVAGFRPFSAACSVGDVAYYSIEAVDAAGVPTGAWETGLATYSAANTLTRTTVIASSNANAAVSFGAGNKRVMLTAVASMLANGSLRTVFSATGVWTKNPRSKLVRVRCYAGGCGGGSGSLVASGTVASGGAGGGGGAMSEATFDAAILGATETVVVGAGERAAPARRPQAAARRHRRRPEPLWHLGACLYWRPGHRRRHWRGDQ
jgi:hypothetical protein